MKFELSVLNLLRPLPIRAWIFAALITLSGCGSTEIEPAEKPAAIAIPETAPPPLWKPLARDNIHDPDNESLAFLQEPEEALSLLPEAQEGGNNINWVAALQNGDITPRAKIAESSTVRVLDLDILMDDTAGMPAVVFPHKTHTEWLDCSNCHDKIFKAKAGANDFGMLDVLQGEYCGQCHGAVSFPLTQCTRCHSQDHQ